VLHEAILLARPAARSPGFGSPRPGPISRAASRAAAPPALPAATSRSLPTHAHESRATWHSLTGRGASANVDICS